MRCGAVWWESAGAGKAFERCCGCGFVVVGVGVECGGFEMRNGTKGQPGKARQGKASQVDQTKEELAWFGWCWLGAGCLPSAAGCWLLGTG